MSRPGSRVEFPLELLSGVAPGVVRVFRELGYHSVGQVAACLGSEALARLVVRALGGSAADAEWLAGVCRRVLGRAGFDRVLGVRLPRKTVLSGVRVDETRLKRPHVRLPPLPVPEAGTKTASFVLDVERLGPVFDQGDRGTCACAALKPVFQYCFGVDVSVEFAYGIAKKFKDPRSTEDGALLRWVPETLQEIGYLTEDELAYRPEAWEGNPGHLPLGGSPECEAELLRRARPLPRSSFLPLDVEWTRKHVTTVAGVNPWSVAVPVVVGLVLFESSLRAAAVGRGYMTEPLPGEEPMGGHALVLIGWQRTRKDGYVALRNSWGPTLPTLLCPYRSYYQRYVV